MKQIFSGNVCEIIEKPDGIVFSYIEEVLNDGFFIKYKMLDMKSGSVNEIAKNVYFLTKFGSNYRHALKVAEHHITSKAIPLPGGKLFLSNKSGECFLLDGDGTVLWTGAIIYRENPPYDIALYNNCVWATFTDNNVLIKFNLATMREELRIGGTKSPFLAPKGIFIEGNTAIVCNAGSNSLTKINLDTYAVEEYAKFEESIKSYVKVGAFEYVLLKSGIYQL